MPTLEGFNGASLAPDIMGALNRGAGAFQAVRQIGRQNAADDAVTAAMTGDQDALARLAALNPQVAGVVSNIVAQKDEKAALKLQQEAQEMARYAGFALQTDPAQRAQALVTIGQEFQKQGRDVAPIVNILRMPPEQQELELKRILATQASLDDVYRQQFGGDMVKGQMGAGVIVDIGGTQYFSNPIFDPASKTMKTELTPVAGGQSITVNGDPATGSAVTAEGQPVGPATIVSKTTGLTPGGTVEQRGAESAAAERGKKGAGSRRVYMDEGLAASDGLSSITKAMKLLDDVSTGGVTSTAGLRLKQFLGTESADEGELSGLLGKAVLSQLRSVFGAQFTAAEGQRLEGIEAGFGKNTETNKRLLKNAFETLDRAAQRGIRAAEAEGDEFTANEIRMNLETAKAALEQASDDAGGGDSGGMTPEQKQRLEALRSQQR